jgi:hypothetical protein
MPKTTQHTRLLNLLRSYNGDYCPLPKILDLHISQYGRVINDLRHGKHDGIFYNIENKLLDVVNGERHTGFRLIEGEPARTEQESAVAHSNLGMETQKNVEFLERDRQLVFIP